LDLAEFSYFIWPNWIQLGPFGSLLAMAEWDFSIRPAAFPLGKNRQKWPTNRPPGNPVQVTSSTERCIGCTAWPDDFFQISQKYARIRQAELIKSARNPPEIEMILGRFSPQG
jgi:hypothetical protein